MPSPEGLALKSLTGFKEAVVLSVLLASMLNTRTSPLQVAVTEEETVLSVLPTGALYRETLEPFCPR